MMSGFRVRFAAVALAGISLVSCSSGVDSAPPATEIEEPSGVQTVTGTAPPAQGNFPSIVVLEPIGGGPLPAQQVPPRMDQAQQTFIPPVLLVRTGEPVDFLNHDEELHNVRVRDEDTRQAAFNVAIPTGGTYSFTFQHDGFYDVGCDIHPGMSAQIMASSSPYMVLADASGAFAIPGVPDGPYKAVVYSGPRRIERDVSIGPGSTELTLTDSEPAAP